MNPVDYVQRDFGFPAIASYPAIVGSDIAGIVVSAGSNIRSNTPKSGTRVAAFASSFYQQGAPDYGAFQKYVLVPSENAVPLPDNLPFQEGSILPMAVETAWAGWYTIGITHDTQYTPVEKQAALVWGGSSSVGSAAVQSAKIVDLPSMQRLVRYIMNISRNLEQTESSTTRRVTSFLRS